MPDHPLSGALGRRVVAFHSYLKVRGPGGKYYVVTANLPDYMTDDELLGTLGSALFVGGTGKTVGEIVQKLVSLSEAELKSVLDKSGARNLEVREVDPTDPQVMEFMPHSSLLFGAGEPPLSWDKEI